MATSATVSRAAVPAWMAHCADLVDELPTVQRDLVIATLHSSYLEGGDPTREHVARLVRVVRGEVTADAAVAEVQARFGVG